MTTTRLTSGAVRARPPGPLDLAASLAPLSRWGDDLVDRWDGARLAGTAAISAGPVPYLAVARGGLAEPWLDVIAPASPGEVAAALVARLPAPPPEFAGLCRRDPVVGRLAGRFPGVRPVLRPDLLTALVHCVSAQQVNLAWAATTRRRLALAFGRRQEVAGVEVYRHDAGRLAAASVAEVRSLQFTTAKAATLVEVARAMVTGRLGLADLAGLPDAEVVARLTALRGIGTWSAEWVLARTLGRPVVVAGDLGVRRAVGAAYGLGPLPAPDEVRRATAHWGGAALAGQTLLLHAWAEGVLTP
jgi:DNA-3-methyladenine glycosylase II